VYIAGLLLSLSVLSLTLDDFDPLLQKEWWKPNEMFDINVLSPLLMNKIWHKHQVVAKMLTKENFTQKVFHLCIFSFAFIRA
jgi:hypothetical protein